MIKKITFLFCISSLMLSSAWANTEIATVETPVQTENQQKLIGQWHCTGGQQGIRYSSHLTYRADSSYSDQGTIHQLIAGKWASFQYQGQGQWNINRSRVLTVQNYKLLKYLPTQEDLKMKRALSQEVSKAKVSFNQNDQIFNLVYTEPTLRNLAIQCTKKA